MNLRLSLWCASIPIAALLACSTSHSRVEANWGESIGHTMGAQTATNGNDGPRGLDAATAERVAEKYYGGAEAPAQPAAAVPSAAAATGVVVGSAASASAAAPTQ